VGRQGITLLALDAKILALNGTRVGWVLAAILLIVLVAAWMDGGEAPLRPIEQSVALPGGGR